MADFYLKSGAGAIERANDAAKVLGNKIVIARADTTANYLVVRKWVMECTTAGTTGAAVPAWPATVAAADTLADGTATWTFRKPGFSSGTTANWAFSAIYMDYVASAMAAGDTLYVSNNHAETTAVAITITFPGTLAEPTRVICGSDAAIPPTAVAVTGAVETTLSSNITIAGAAVYVYGLICKIGTGTGAPSLFYATNGRLSLVDSTINFVATGASPNLFVGNNSAARAILQLTNTKMTFGATSSGIVVNGGELVWDGGGITAGSAITTLMKIGGSNARGFAAMLSGLDLTGCAAGVVLFAGGGTAPFDGTIRNCKLPAAWTGTLTNGTLAPGQRHSMYNCDSGDTNYRMWVEDDKGSIKSETTIVRTGGASDGTTALSWCLTSSANAEYPLLVLRAPEIVVWNETTAAAKTVAVEVLHFAQGSGASGALTDADSWVEAQYLGTAGFPLSKFISDAKATVLAAAADQTATTEAWDSLTTAYSATVDYVLGDVVEPTTANGALYKVTTDGGTTGAEPTWGTVDGGTTTDAAGRIWTRSNRQKLHVTFTPEEKGYISLVPCLAKASATIYVCPKATVG